MHYKETAQAGNSYLHLWDVASIKTFDGGFLFDKTSIPEGTERLPKGVFLRGDFVERKATLIKTVKVTKAVAVSDTEVRIAKGHLLLATDIIGVAGKAILVGTIDTSNDDYDAITITAGALGAVAINTILQSYSAASSGGVKGVFELEVTANATAGDKIQIAGIEYEFAAAIDAGKIVIGATVGETVANLDNALEQELALTSLYNITFKGAKITFTQKVAGVGAIPELVVTPTGGTLAATIAQKTPAVPATGAPILPDGLNPVEVELDKEASCSIMFRADGIVTSRLPQAPTEEIKAALRDCQFLNK